MTERLICKKKSRLIVKKTTKRIRGVRIEKRPAVIYILTRTYVYACI